MEDLFRIRTITGFVRFHPDDFPTRSNKDDLKLLKESPLGQKISKLVSSLRDIETELTQAGYTVQSIRLATNPFSEWLVEDSSNGNSGSDADDSETIEKVVQIAQSRLEILDHILSLNTIESVSLGPAEFEHKSNEVIEALCCKIIDISPRFFCSVNIASYDVNSARLAAQCMLAISRLGSRIDADKNKNSDSNEKENKEKAHVIGGLGNFRFCAAASCKPYIPFFPAGKSSSISDENGNNRFEFALGLENGSLARKLLKDCKSIGNIKTEFLSGMANALEPLQSICETIASRQKNNLEYVGIDSSLNPSLEEGGSVAEAIEQLEEMNGRTFGSPGTLAAAAAITESIQSLPNTKLTGYCGLMLPLCEDRRLADLVNNNANNQGAPNFCISDLLNISNVCGVGVDTVPIPGDCSEDDLTSFLLDVAGIAGRWNKSLSCRLFPIPGKSVREMTTFDFQHLVNVRVLGL